MLDTCAATPSFEIYPQVWHLFKRKKGKMSDAAWASCVDRMLHYTVKQAVDVLYGICQYFQRRCKSFLIQLGEYRILECVICVKPAWLFWELWEVMVLVITRSMLLDIPSVVATGELRILVLEDPKLHTSFFTGCLEKWRAWSRA